MPGVLTKWGHSAFIYVCFRGSDVRPGDNNVDAETRVVLHEWKDDIIKAVKESNNEVIEHVQKNNNLKFDHIKEQQETFKKLHDEHLNSDKEIREKLIPNVIEKVENNQNEKTSRKIAIAAVVIAAIGIFVGAIL